MNTALPTSAAPQDTEARYRDNFARHVLGLSLYLQADIMGRLRGERGHPDLRLSFEPYITIIGSNGVRISDIADLLGISRQAANQTANQIEAAGYIERRAHPTDGRARLVVATPRGLQLRTDGALEAARIQAEMARIVGEPALDEAIGVLARIAGELGLPPVPREGTGNGDDARIAALLPRLGDYLYTRLMTLTEARGHSGLKRNFGHVLTAIGPRGGRIQQMAEAQGVSKQAISAIATELEELGYIHRVPDPGDARQVLLQFTGSGRRLIADSVAAVDDVYREFTSIAGRGPMRRSCATLRALYRALHLEEDVFDNSAAVDIRVLAGQLTRQLGEEGARALARLLLQADGRGTTE